MTDQFDAIVIGAGPGGYVCAIRLAQLGLKTACVEEKSTLGGTCLNVGCIPSKALLESSHLYHNAVHNFDAHGISTNKVSFDLGKMLKRKDSVVSDITKGVEFLFSKNKITWLKGRGSFKDKNTVTVAGKDYKATNIVIASGSYPVEIPTAKFDHKTVIDSTDALNLQKVPKHLVVVGGGVIGLELGSVWKRLGADVTVVEALDSILATTDSQVSTQAQKIFAKQGIKFHLESFLEKVETDSSGAKVYCKSKDKSFVIDADKVLIAVGRGALSQNLGLDKVGVKVNSSSQIETDSSLRTNVENIYAVGDVTKGAMLAHKASEEGLAVAETIAGKSGHVNYRAIPSIVYTWPEIASVGLSEQECKEQGLAYNVGKFSYKANGRARAAGESEGFVKIIADKKTDLMLGVHIIGAQASELISEVVIAFEYGASAEDLARSSHGHPTLAEMIKEAALDVDKRAIHS
jgi:dihydrolipoamide dehydrogenase